MKATVTVRGCCRHYRAECLFKRNRVLHTLLAVAETPEQAAADVKAAALEIEPLLVFI